MATQAVFTLDDINNLIQGVKTPKKNSRESLLVEHLESFLTDGSNMENNILLDFDDYILLKNLQK